MIASLVTGVTLARREARLAERRFAQVREVANTFLFQLYDQVTPLPGSTAVRASIVETARKYLDGLSAEAQGDTQLTLELAAAYVKLGDVQGRTGTSNLGQLDDARRSYQRAIDLYTGLPVTAASSEALRRRLAAVLLAYARLEYNAYHEDVAGAFTRRMLDLLPDRGGEPATRMMRALGIRSMADTLLRQGRTRDGLAALDSTRRILLDLQNSHYDDARVSGEIAATRERLARARVSAGDLDGAASDFLALLRDTPACADDSPSSAACRTLAVRLVWTGDVYAAVDRPNLHDPVKAASLYARAVQIREGLVGLDDRDRQARFDLAASYGKLGDAIWESDPKRALALYDRALETAKALASKEQLEILKDSYLEAISRPLMQLHRFDEARSALREALARATTDATSQYEDRLSEAFVKTMWCRLLRAEGKAVEARQTVDQVIHDVRALQSGHPDSLETITYLSDAYRLLASLTSGAERQEAFRQSAAAWHAWPATVFTRREEQADLEAAGR